MTASGPLLAPVDPSTEVWAAGVTYLRSREAREAESTVSDLYSRVYDAERPELFFKAVGWRVSGHAMPIRIRRDSRWNVPEPELTLVINARRRDCRVLRRQRRLLAGHRRSEPALPASGQDLRRRVRARTRNFALRAPTRSATFRSSSRSRGTATPIFAGETRTSRIKRPLQELVDYLRKELDFPHGVFLMTGTGIVPPDDFSLAGGDHVRITIGDLTLENEVAR